MIALVRAGARKHIISGVELAQPDSSLIRLLLVSDTPPTLPVSSLCVDQLERSRPPVGLKKMIVDLLRNTRAFDLGIENYFWTCFVGTPRCGARGACKQLHQTTVL